MKRITLCLMLILALILVPGAIFAAENITEVADEAALVEAVKTSGTVKLVKDINVGEFVGTKITVPKNVSVTLDLNGKTISGKYSEETSTQNTALITNKGTLNIVDNSNNKAGKIILSDTGKNISTDKGIFTIVNTGVLVIDDVTIENTRAIGISYAIDNESGNGNAGLTINSGNIIAKKAAIRLFANSTKDTNDVIVNGGTIKGGTSGIWLQQPSKDVAGKASLTVNNGTIEGVGYNGIYATVNNNEKAEAVSITVNSGYIKNNSATSGTITFEPISDNTIDEAIMNLKISGGTINNTYESGNALFNKEYTELNKNNIKISGGKFSSEIDEDFLDNGVICKKIDNLYWVGTEHNITVKEAEGGKIIVRETEAQKEIDKAISGETVEIVVEPAEGYKFKEISGADKIVDVAEYAYQFTMPNKDVVLTPVFEKTTTEAEVPSNIANAEKVENMVVETLKELVAADSNLAEKVEGKNIEIEVQFKSVEVNKEEKEKIEKEAAKEVEGIKVGEYIDITISVKDADTDKEITKLSTVKEAIQFTVEIPKELKADIPEGYTRVFYIIRNHNGDIDVWETKEADGKLSFKSDKFSTYAIAYKDIKDETTVTPPAGDDNTRDETTVTPPAGEGGTGAGSENTPDAGNSENIKENDVPQTGDNIVVYAVLAVVAMASIVVTIKMRKK